MPRTSNLSASTRPIVRWVAVLAIGSGIVTSCGWSPGSSDGPPAAADRSSQPLERVALSAVAPTDGADAARSLDVRRWVGQRRKDACGGVGSFYAEGDRYDQTLFPDLDLIERDGLGLGREVVDPPPPAKPADEACLARTLTEMDDAEKVFGQWMETVVQPTWTSDEIVAKADDAAGCLRERMGWGDDVISSLDAFLPAIDGRLTQADVPGADEIAALDARASAAFVDCAGDTYRAFADLLASKRGAFADRHHDAVAALADALDEGGYTP